MSRIEIVPYDQRWLEEFREIAKVLRTAFGARALRIDHIGSTSVPGLAAKDIIDLQVTLETLNRDLVEEAVTPLGYSLHPGIAEDHVPPGSTSDLAEWSKLYLRASESQRPTHVHIRQAGQANQRYPILFRDYLRAHPAATETYRNIKVALARLHPDDVEAYCDVKDPVCDLVIDSAERWARETNWTPGTTDA